MDAIPLGVYTPALCQQHVLVVRRSITTTDDNITAVVNGIVMMMVTATSRSFVQQGDVKKQIKTQMIDYSMLAYSNKIKDLDISIGDDLMRIQLKVL